MSHCQTSFNQQAGTSQIPEGRNAELWGERGRGFCDLSVQVKEAWPDYLGSSEGDVPSDHVISVKKA